MPASTRANTFGAVAEQYIKIECSDRKIENRHAPKPRCGRSKEQQLIFNADWEKRMRLVERLQFIVLGGALVLGFLGSFLGGYFRTYTMGG